jgi:hypothetical protein
LEFNSIKYRIIENMYCKFGRNASVILQKSISKNKKLHPKNGPIGRPSCRNALLCDAGHGGKSIKFLSWTPSKGATIEGGCQMETGTMQAGLVLLRGAYRVAYQWGAAAWVRILPALGSRNHGAGDGLPQVFRVLGHAVRSSARFATANPQLMPLLLIAIVSLYVLYENYNPQQIA